MKRLAIVFAVLFVFSVSAYAQMGEGMMPMMPMMEKCQQMMKSMTGEGTSMMPMCQQMMGQGMMMKNMVQMMMDMMNMQEKMMMGVGPSEKKQMMKDMMKMKDKMQKMMSMRMNMMGMDDSQSKLKCAEQWLKKAIDLHEIHINDPKTATEASQMEMMDQMKKAYECVSGTGAETGMAPSKKPDGGEKKKDAHGH